MFDTGFATHSFQFSIFTTLPTPSQRMRTLFVLMSFFLLNCARTERNGSLDSATAQSPAADSTITAPLSWGYTAEQYLVTESLAAAQFQQIDRTCAILIAETPEQEAARRAASEVEARERAEREEKARLEWESQPHDSGDYYSGEESEYQGDGDYYNMKAVEFLEELKIPVVTAEPKQYVRLVARKGQAYTLDIRSNMQPNWTIILFHIDREPVVVEAMDVTKERIQEYFFKGSN